MLFDFLLITYCPGQYLALPRCPHTVSLSEHCYSVCDHGFSETHHHILWSCVPTGLSIGRNSNNIRVAPCHPTLGQVLRHPCSFSPTPTPHRQPPGAAVRGTLFGGGWLSARASRGPFHKACAVDSAVDDPRGERCLLDVVRAPWLSRSPVAQTFSPLLVP